MTARTATGSASIEHPDYWWYRARADLLRTVLEPRIGEPRRVLDVGSADGPSVGWLRGRGKQVTIDIDPRGLGPGAVCGSALALPFADESFDVVAAFDVLEHCEPEGTAVTELARVLTPGGRLLLSVPAYEWAWTHFDDDNGHHRRYTRARAVRSLTSGGLRVERSTYAFAGVFPFFAVERLLRRLREGGRRGPSSLAEGEVPALPAVSPIAEKLLMGLCGLDRRLLTKRDLPFGSSVVLAARKVGH